MPDIADIAPMGISYDDENQCWRLDYPARINGGPTHLKATVYGPKRATQAEAMRAWLALEDRAKDPAGSMLFRELAEQYTEKARPAANARRVIDRIVSGVGSTRLKDLQSAGQEWLQSEAERRVKKWRAVDGERTLCDLDRTISPATIQSYKRYIKAILSTGRRESYWPDIAVGQAARRSRAIEAWEMLTLEDVIEKFVLEIV